MPNFMFLFAAKVGWAGSIGVFFVWGITLAPGQECLEVGVVESDGHHTWGAEVPTPVALGVLLEAILLRMRPLGA